MSSNSEETPSHEITHEGDAMNAQLAPKEKRQPDTRTLDAHESDIRKAIYDWARTGKTFSIDDITETLKSRGATNRIHALLLSAYRIGLLEKVGKAQSRAFFDATEWLEGGTSHKRQVQTYRGSSRIRKEPGK